MKNIENYLYEEAYIFNKALITRLSSNYPPQKERQELKALTTANTTGSPAHNKR